MIIRRKFTSFESTTQRYIGTAMRITAEQAKAIQAYKSTKRKLARKSYVVEARYDRSNKP